MNAELPTLNSERRSGEHPRGSAVGQAGKVEGVAGRQPERSAELHVGDMVTLKNGMPGTFMVLRLLADELVRIRRWPILEAPPAEEVSLADLAPAEQPHLQPPPLGGEPGGINGAQGTALPTDSTLNPQLCGE